MPPRQFQLAFVLLGIVTILAGAFATADEPGSGNPLRLIADPSRGTHQSQPDTSRRQHQTMRVAVQESTESFPTATGPDIPPEVQQALYPKQTAQYPPVAINQPENKQLVRSTFEMEPTTTPVTAALFQADVLDARAKSEFQNQSSSNPEAREISATGNVKTVAHLEPQTYTKQPTNRIPPAGADSSQVLNMLPRDAITEEEPAHRPERNASAARPAASAVSFTPLHSTEQDSFALGQPPRHESQSDSSAAATPSRGQTLKSLLDESNTTKHSEFVSSPKTPANSFEKNDSPTKVSSQQDFQQLLTKIATSTGIVLVLGVGFVIVAKRWTVWNGTGGRSRSQKQSGPPVASERLEFRIVSNLRLSPKSNLHLVEIGEQRLIVASDPNGIKSVTPLNQPFSAALDELTDSIEEKGAAAETYTPAARSSFSSKNSNAEIEADMQRKLAEVLGGEAFKDVFYKANRAVA